MPYHTNTLLPRSYQIMVPCRCSECNASSVGAGGDNATPLGVDVPVAFVPRYIIILLYFYYCSNFVPRYFLFSYHISVYVR